MPNELNDTHAILDDEDYDTLEAMLMSECEPDMRFINDMIAESREAQHIDEEVLTDIVILINNNPSVYFKSKHLVPESEMKDSFLIGRVLKDNERAILYRMLPLSIWDNLNVETRITSPAITHGDGEMWMHVSSIDDSHVDLFRPLENTDLLNAVNTAIEQVTKARDNEMDDIVEITTKQ